ncbi:hypothetical protein ACSBR1_019160 [Camellia fascicularis]
MAPAESVVVVMDANHRKVSVEAVDWAIKHIVRPRDTVVVLGVLSEVGKKTTTSSSSSSCLPFHVGASLSRICKSSFSFFSLPFLVLCSNLCLELESSMIKESHEFSYYMDGVNL